MAHINRKVVPALLPEWASGTPRGWTWSLLSDACLGIFDCPHSTPQTIDDGPYFLARTPDVVSGVFRADTARRVSHETYVERSIRAEPRFGDLLFSREGTYFGAAAEVPPNTKVCLGQRMVLLRPDPQRVNPKFLRLWLNSPQIQAHIGGHRDGSVAERLNLPTIRRIPVVVPPLIEQRAIAEVLGSLDDKIELNRKIDETLEQMARALFKSWFVDFDPVHAKAAGRHPAGMNAETAKLFPSEFQDSDLGRIPKGWTRSRLDSWVSILSGGTPSKSDASLWSGSIPWISPKTMSSIHVTDAEDRVTAAAIGNGTRIAPSSSTLVMVRGMGLHRAVRISQARRDVTFNQDVKALVPNGIHPSLLLFALLNMQSDLLGRVESSGHGTGKLPTERLLGCEITLPSIEVQACLAQIFDQANDLFATNELEAVTLGRVRDVLLPRLLSGEIDIASADRGLGASASLV